MDQLTTSHYSAGNGGNAQQHESVLSSGGTNNVSLLMAAPLNSYRDHSLKRLLISCETWLHNCRCLTSKISSTLPRMPTVSSSIRPILWIPCLRPSASRLSHLSQLRKPSGGPSGSSESAWGKSSRSEEIVGSSNTLEGSSAIQLHLRAPPPGSHTSTSRS